MILYDIEIKLAEILIHFHWIRILRTEKNNSISLFRITELDNGILLDLPDLQLLDVSSNQISRLSRDEAF